jgi:hypothetical protein
MGLGRLAAVAAAVGMAPLCVAWAQAPADACALMSRDEFQTLTGKPEYTNPTGMPWGNGTICGFGNGQILLFTGEDSQASFDQMLAGFGH